MQVVNICARIHSTKGTNIKKPETEVQGNLLLRQPRCGEDLRFAASRIGHHLTQG